MSLPLWPHLSSKQDNVKSSQTGVFNMAINWKHLGPHLKARTALIGPGNVAEKAKELTHTHVSLTSG